MAHADGEAREIDHGVTDEVEKKEERTTLYLLVNLRLKVDVGAREAKDEAKDRAKLIVLGAVLVEIVGVVFLLQGDEELVHHGLERRL